MCTSCKIIPVTNSGTVTGLRTLIGDLEALLFGAYYFLAMLLTFLLKVEMFLFQLTTDNSGKSY